MKYKRGRICSVMDDDADPQLLEREESVAPPPSSCMGGACRSGMLWDRPTTGLVTALHCCHGDVGNGGGGDGATAPPTGPKVSWVWSGRSLRGVERRRRGGGRRDTGGWGVGGLQKTEMRAKTPYRRAQGYATNSCWPSIARAEMKIFEAEKLHQPMTAAVMTIPITPL